MKVVLSVPFATIVGGSANAEMISGSVVSVTTVKVVFSLALLPALSEITCPCGEHKSYADHYLVSFLSSLRELG
ncbi:MAG TPA: hypothetical protein EYP22_04800, partial [Methanosarcinales archaeon]|nr:hypothetical protein [Methanosarcinales archaeon]